MQKLKEDFFARSTRQVALELLGKYLVRNLDGRNIYGRITWTEAYAGMNKRDRKGIKYSPGRIYMYPVRGYYNLNISTEAENVPACVLIAELDIGGKGYGQINLLKRLKIDKSFDGKSIESDDVWIEDGIREVEPKATNCFGSYRTV